MKPQILAFIEESINSHTKAVLTDTLTSERNSPPVVYMHKGSQRTVVFIVPGEDESPMDCLKTVVAKFNPDAYIFAAESWLKVIDSKTKEGKALGKKLASGKIRVKDQADKEENLIFTYGIKNGEKGMRLFNIVRDKTKRIIELPQRDDADWNDFESSKTP
jgi:hypothetical protein